MGVAVRHLANLLLLTVCLVLLAVPLRAADVKVSAHARKLFNTGVKLLDDKEGSRYEEAYRNFKAAYADSPSPLILGNIGLCAMKLERYGEAIEAYERYLKEVSDIDAEERKQITEDLPTLKGSVVRVVLNVEPAGATVTDTRIAVKGDKVVNRYGPLGAKLEIGIRPGSHELRVELDGYTSQVWRLEALPGKTPEKTMRLEKKPTGTTPQPPLPGPTPVPTAAPTTSPTTPPPGPTPTAGVVQGDDTTGNRPVPTGVYVTLGLTGVLAVAAGVTGGLALSKNSAYDDQFKSDGSVEDQAAAESLRDDGQTLNIVTDVLIGSAAAAGVTTLVWYLARPTVEPATQTSWLLLPTLSKTGPGLWATKRF